MVGNPREMRRLAGTAAIAVVAAGSVGATETFMLQASRVPVPVVRLYSDDPAHLWNRLHASLFVRVAADGREYGADRVDPLLWVGSTYLLHGPSHTRALKLLNEFVDTHGERLLRDPLKRAILQRDLWAIFDWMEGTHIPYEQPQLTPELVRKSVDELCKPLTTAIARLALTLEEIRTLPDNYAAAARANRLPADLFAPDGPWVSLGRPDGPIAVQHVRDSGPGKNSVFLVLIRLPGGRDATLKYLQGLRTFNGPLWVRDTNAPSGMQEDFPNPDLPQFPVGTQMALVRRALLIDSTGRIAPNRLTEQVQLRTYREIRAMTVQEFADAHRVDENMFARAGQDFDEFSLSRAALFGEHEGGLLPLAALDRFFLTFSSHGVDEFDMRSMEQHAQLGTDPASAKQVCKDCHGAPGVYSFNSYVPFRLTGPGVRQAPRLSEISLVEAERTAVVWKQQQSDWRLLQPLLQP